MLRTSQIYTMLWCYSLKSHTDGVTLSRLYSFCPKRKTAVKIFVPLMSFCGSEPKTTTTSSRKIPTYHGDTTMEPLLVHKKWRFPPIMLIVAGSYNENHMEASLFSESWNMLLTLSMRVVCTDWLNSVMRCLCFLPVICTADNHTTRKFKRPSEAQTLSGPLWKGVHNDSALQWLSDPRTLVVWGHVQWRSKIEKSLTLCQWWTKYTSQAFKEKYRYPIKIGTKSTKVFF